MIKTKDLIVQLKAVKEEKQLSLGDIYSMVEDNGDFCSKTSLSRLFSEGSEEQSFKEETLIPVARALLDVENLEETDDLDTQAMKTLLQYKSQRIKELEKQVADLEMALDREKLKYHEKLDIERERNARSVEFLKMQVDKKDDRIDKLLQAVYEKDKLYNELLNQYLSCPYSKIGKEKSNDNCQKG